MGLMRPALGADSHPRNDLLRLHIVANSDSEHDQQVKLMVRDAILKHTAEALTGVRTVTEAFEYLTAEKDNVRKVVESQLAECGVYQEFSMQIGWMRFPTRAYKDKIVPAGVYRAIRVVLGDGAGANWWCVVFPPLCLGNTATKSNSKSDSRPEVIDDECTERLEVRPKLAVLEWARAKKDTITAIVSRKH